MMFEEYPKVKPLNKQDLSIWLMSEEDIYCIEKGSRFCEKAFRKQDRQLKQLNKL